MSFVVDHIGPLTTIIVLVFGLVATWTRMNYKLNELEKMVMENRRMFDVGHGALTAKLDKEIVAAGVLHKELEVLIREHHEDTTVHSSLAEREWRMEWRKQVIDRLTRMEEMLITLMKRNGLGLGAGK